MKPVALVVFFVCLLTYIPTTANFDRAALHEARILPVSEGSRIGSIGRSAGSAVSTFAEQAVSESSFPARFSQDHSSIVALDGGGWLVAWDDNRDGASKIYWQRYDQNGVPLGANVRIASSAIGHFLVEPVLKVDTLNRVHLYYRDQTAGYVLGSRFTSDLAVDLSPFLINDTTGEAAAGPFAFDVYPDGRSVVVWENYDGSGSTIAGRIVTPTGGFVSAPFTVNSDIGSASHWVPAIAVEPSAGFLVCWEDYRNANADIYARLFDGAGSPLAADFALVPAPANSANQFAPTVMLVEADRYAIAWIDQRIGQDAYLQEYRTNSGLFGPNALISQGDGVTITWDIDLAVSGSNAMLATWASFEASSTISGRNFNNALAPVSDIKTLNQGVLGQRWRPASAFISTENYIMAWTELPQDNPDLTLMLFDTSGTALLGAEVAVNDDVRGAPSTNPAVVASEDWYHVFVYMDQNRDAGDIYVKAIHSLTGIAADYSQRVNQDSAANLQSEPCLASAQRGTVLIGWIDARPLGGVSGPRIFGRLTDLAGRPLTGEFLISDSLQVAVKSTPKIAMNRFSRALVVWLDKRGGDYAVFGQWLNGDQTPDGSEFQISDPSETIPGGGLQVTYNESVGFLVSRVDLTTSPPTLRTTRYRDNGDVAGSFTFAPSFDEVALDEMSVVATNTGSLAVFWTGTAGAYHRAWLTLQDTTGTIVGTTQVITDSDLASPGSPSISVDQHDYISLCWEDFRDGRRAVFYQLLDDSRVPLEVNQAVSSGTPELMMSTMVANYGDRVWFTWVDSREYGLNVYAATYWYLPTDVDDDLDSSVPSEYSLSQNYPNPFNPSTSISFSLPVASEVSLTVFNSLGQRVRELASGVFTAGNHEVVWDATDQAGQEVASGVYFYRLTAGDVSEQRKMLLLK